MIQYPESEFKAERGMLKIKELSFKHINGTERVSADGEISSDRIQECRMAICPLRATLLV